MEIIKREHPWPGIKAGEIMNKVVAGERPELSSHLLENSSINRSIYEDIIKRCWQADPNQRPSAKDLREAIQ